MRIQPELSRVDILVSGDFNPTIFSPRWLCANGLIRASLADSAQVRVIHPEISVFAADWLHIRVVRDRLSVWTMQAPYVRLRDLVLRIFSECLPHTTLRAFSINFSVLFLVDNPATRDRIGRTLAPVEPWGPLRQSLALDGTSGGMTGLQMSQLAPRGRNRGGQINVNVEPSARVGSSETGVLVSVNDHFAGSNVTSAADDSLMEVLGQEFKPSLKRSEGIVDQVMSLAKPMGE